MSLKALTPINVPWAAADPATPSLRAGDLYANSGTGALRIYNGSAWANVGAGGSGTPATTVQTESGLDTGQVGTSTNYAREDHRHPITNVVDLASAQTISALKTVTANAVATTIGSSLSGVVGITLANQAAATATNTAQLPAGLGWSGNYWDPGTSTSKPFAAQIATTVLDNTGNIALRYTALTNNVAGTGTHLFDGQLIGIGGVYDTAGTNRVYSASNANLSGTVAVETTWGLASSAGTATTYSRGDHTHGTQPTPVTSIGVGARTGAVTLTAADIGAGTFPGSYTVTGTLYVNSTLNLNSSSFPNVTFQPAGQGSPTAQVIASASTLNFDVAASGSFVWRAPLNGTTAMTLTAAGVLSTVSTISATQFGSTSGASAQFGGAASTGFYVDATNVAIRGSTAAGAIYFQGSAGGGTSMLYHPSTGVLDGLTSITATGTVTAGGHATSTGTISARGSTYGTFSVSGSAGGWAGLTFTDFATNQTMMMNAGGFGVYDAATTSWRWMFSGNNAGTAGQWSLTNGLVPADRVSAGTFPASTYFGGSDTGMTSDGTNGYVRLQRGDATHAGYVPFYGNNNVRQGYIGWAASAGFSATGDAGNIAYVANGGHWFTGGLTATSVAEGSTSGAVRVYSPNNNPAYTDIVNLGSASVNFATTAGSANAAAWSNVSGKPLNNIRGGATTVTFTAGTGTIAHGLGTTPISCVVAKGPDGGNDGIVVCLNGATSWTSTNINVRASTGTTAFAGSLSVSWIAFS